MTLDLRAHLQSVLGDAYTIEREIGGGGMSRVYLAEDTALRRRIVIKVLPPEMAAEVSLARFQREIALAARLQHPHIVPLLASGETPSLPYYTMPLVEGESLREWLTRGGELPVVEAARLMREIATALAYAHEKGIVHRDIKPENVLLSGGIALVTDFGVAKALLVSATSAEGGLTGTGISIGTPAYMSPEQVSADAAVDHRADIYALGMIAYEMLAGQAPFAGRSGQALLSAHVIDTPDPIDKRRPAVPPALAALVMRCLEKRPADRPQNASEIIQALDAVTTPTQTVARPVASRRMSRAMVSVVTLLLIVVAGVAWRWVTHRAPPVAAASRVLVAPFENLTGDPAFDHIGRIAADQIAMAVAQNGSMDVVPSNIVLMALRDTTGGMAAQLKRLSDATHAALIVSGTIVRRGDSLALQGQVTEVRTGKVIATLDPATSAAADPVAAVSALGDRLLGVLGMRELAILSQRGYRAPTSAAYQEFAKGFERFAVDGDPIGSRPFFERAIAIDSTYTRAYQLLGRQYLNAHEYARADSMARRIERLPQGLSAGERLQLDYMWGELHGDIRAQLRSQQQLVARDSSPLASQLLGEAAVWLLRPDLAVPAIEYAHAAFVLMGGAATRSHVARLAEAYHEAGAYDRELRALLDQRAVFPDVGSMRGGQLYAYAGLAQGGRALVLADTMVRANSDSSGVVLQRIARGAQEFRAHGDTNTASRLLETARDWMTAHPARSPTRDRLVWEGTILLAGGMADSASVRFASAARDTTRIDAAGFLALAYVARGDRVRARAIADSLGGLRRRWIFGEHTFWRAAIVGALGDHELAVTLLEQANREGQPMHTWHYHPALDSLRRSAAFATLVRPQR